MDDEGNTLRVRDTNYFASKLIIGTTAYQCSATLRVKIIFLDEESYKNYLNDNTSGITPFKFSDINFMGCSFSVGITLGVEQVGVIE